MIKSKKYVVFYREFPTELEEFLVQDGHSQFTKDGIKVFKDEHRCPRLTIVVDPTGNRDIDKKRILDLERMLERLEKLYIIVGYIK